MKKKLPYILVINIDDFSMELFSTKQSVANTVGCHRNTLKEIDGRMTIGKHIIIPLTPKK